MGPSKPQEEYTGKLMHYRKHYVYSWITLSCLSIFNMYPSQVDLFDTTFLRQSRLVERYLVSTQGFTAGYFQTDDQHDLHYLFKKRAHARVTIIAAVGFWRGHKEGMATLYALLPDDCNLMLFDARGRGKSSGFYYSLWRYGVDEYKDIQAAITFAQTQDTCPIILYGICAGAFHAAHALSNQQPLIVRGLIMDSAWASVTQVSKTALTSELKKHWHRTLQTYITHQGLRTALYGTVTGITNISVCLLHRIIFVPLLYPYRNQTDLLVKIKNISVPILYIHSRDDEYTVTKPVEKLIAATQKPYAWWIEQPSTHAAHHLKYRLDYQNKITEFINQLLR